MVTTDDSELWSRMWSYKDHGKSWEAVYGRTHSPGFRWVHDSFGTNWRMTEMSAAIGRIQLRRMKQWTERRTTNATRLSDALAQCKALRVPLPPSNVQHAWYKFYAFVRPENLKPDWNRDRIMAEINAAAVPCSTGACSEVYLEKAFDHTVFRPAERLAVAKVMGETSLMFLVHPTLSEMEMNKTASVVHDIVSRATYFEAQGVPMLA